MYLCKYNEILCSLSQNNDMYNDFFEEFLVNKWAFYYNTA